MVEVATHTKVTVDNDDICKDDEARKDKGAVMKQQGKNAFFSSISQVATFMAGILTAAGMGIVGSILQEAAKTAAATHIPLTLATTLSSVPTVGVVLLAAAAVTTFIAVGSNMMALKMGSSAYFDQSEANAKHNAKYIVQELKQAHSKQFECEQNQRPDGQKWASVMESRKQAAVQNQI